MIRILTIIGARPQIIKAAAISRAIHNSFADQVEEIILHTGQHYDENMSGAFFAELGIPEPDYNLHVGSGKHGEQTAKMIDGIEKVLLSEHFDGIILYGDTNSTLAGAVAAGKLHIPIYHIEAGLRSYNMGMPEEQNRIVCDHLSSILFAPTQTAINNLQEEGLIESAAHFANGKRRKVVLSGDVMYDNSMYFISLAEQKSTILEQYDLQKKKFALATIHRDNNTDNPDRLTAIFKAILHLAKNGTKFVVPLHPRTAKLLPNTLPTSIYNEILAEKNICIIPPASFFDIMMLEKYAQIVITDSGGVQKEAFFYETPCIILRPETEWIEITNSGAGILADANYDKILASFDMLENKEVAFPPLFGNAHAAEIIIQTILDQLANQ